MRSIIKLCLLVLLMAAIPLQGFAGWVGGCTRHEQVAVAAGATVDADDADCVHQHSSDARSKHQQEAHGALDAHGKCGGGCCAATVLAPLTLAAAPANPRSAEVGLFRSAYFYRLSLAPLERPPVL